MELKEGDYKELYADERVEKTFVRECQIETDYDMYIPDKYITGSHERLNVYTELNQMKTEKELIVYLSQLKDVYGKLPNQIQDICDAIRLKWLATKLGVERIIIKSGKMRCYLVQNQESPFYKTDIFGKILNIGIFIKIIVLFYVLGYPLIGVSLFYFNGSNQDGE